MAKAKAKSAKESKAKDSKANGSKTKSSKANPVGETPLRQDGHPPLMAIELPQAELTPEIAAYFDKCREKIGYVPNVLLAYAHDMAKLEAFAGMYNDLMLAPSGLSKLEREMIAVAVSSENRCFYCLASHGAAVRVLSGDPVLGELLVMNWRAAKLSKRHKAMLTFATKMTRASYEIVEEDRDALRKAGFSTRDIWDIASVAAFFNMTNRLSSALDMRPNVEYHRDGR